jgi:hypothetical protein
MALRRAIRSLKKAGPGLLRRPSARSSGLSHTGLGAAAALIGRAINVSIKAKGNMEQRCRMEWDTEQNMEHSSRAETRSAARDCGSSTPCVKDAADQLPLNQL